MSCFWWAESHLMQSSLLRVMLIWFIANAQSMERWPLQWSGTEHRGISAQSSNNNLGPLFVLSCLLVYKSDWTKLPELAASILSKNSAEENRLLVLHIWVSLKQACWMYVCSSCMTPYSDEMLDCKTIINAQHSWEAGICFILYASDSQVSPAASVGFDPM